MATTQEVLDRSNKTRLQLLEEAALKDCADGCGGRWLAQGEDILLRNNIEKRGFCQAIRVLLNKGRGKNRNLLLTGPANCGKTFLLLPLTLIFDVFSNPATTTFAWVGAEKSEVIFLNDFRWSPQLIPWHDLLLLLEGGLVHLPAPKTHFAKDLTLVGDTPVFATSKHAPVFIKAGAIDDVETEMMAVRWRQFILQSQIPLREQQSLPPCGSCFAKFVLHDTQT